MDFGESLPVFLQPSEINFVLGKPETYKSLLTLFNPYPFPVRFKVLCNAPAKYRVELTKGCVRAGCYLDTTIRHKNPTSVESDCLRVEIYRIEDRYPCGRKDIPLNVLLEENVGQQRNNSSLAEFTDDSGATSGGTGAASSSAFGTAPHPHLRGRSIIPTYETSRKTTMGAVNTEQQPPRGPHLQQQQARRPPFLQHWLALASFLFCASILLLPRSPDPVGQDSEGQQQPQQQWIPAWVRPSHTSQCVCSYVLGILTVYFFLQPAAV